MNSEEKFRLGHHRCERCHKESRTIGSVWIGETVKAWCTECMFAAIREHIPVTIATNQCERCDATIVQRYGVFWMARNQRWCEQCVMEVEKVQRAKGNVLD